MESKPDLPGGRRAAGNKWRGRGLSAAVALAVGIAVAVFSGSGGDERASIAQPTTSTQSPSNASEPLPLELDYEQAVKLDDAQGEVSSAARATANRLRKCERSLDRNAAASETERLNTYATCLSQAVGQRAAALRGLSSVLEEATSTVSGRCEQRLETFNRLVDLTVEWYDLTAQLTRKGNARAAVKAFDNAPPPKLYTRASRDAISACGGTTDTETAQSAPQPTPDDGEPDDVAAAREFAACSKAALAQSRTDPAYQSLLNSAGADALNIYIESMCGSP